MELVQGRYEEFLLSSGKLALVSSWIKWSTTFLCDSNIFGDAVLCAEFANTGDLTHKSLHYIWLVILLTTEVADLSIIDSIS